jgi:hypothetical protein
VGQDAGHRAVHLREMTGRARAFGSHPAAAARDATRYFSVSR